MDEMGAEHGTRTPRCWEATSRRVLVAAGAGWVLSAAGLFLPAAGDEAEARNGAMGGKFGGRRGKDHRGRDKHRGKNRNAGDNNKTSHDEGLFDPANISLTVQNFTSSGIQILHTSGDLREWRSVAAGATDIMGQRDPKLNADIYMTTGCPDPSEYYTKPWSYPVGCNNFGFGVELENPPIERPDLKVIAPGGPDAPAYYRLSTTAMSEHDEIDLPDLNCWVRRETDSDFKNFTLQLCC